MSLHPGRSGMLQFCCADRKCMQSRWMLVSEKPIFHISIGQKKWNAERTLVKVAGHE
jgi:hypothetical protein